MVDFVSLATWLHEPQPEALEVLEEPSVVIEEAQPADERQEQQDEDALLDEVCARLRRFRAMLDDAFAYVRERGTPAAPLRVRVHPTQLSSARAIGLPLAPDAQLREEEAVIELRCGSIDAQLSVPFARLLTQHQS